MKKILIFSLAYYPSHISGAEIAIKEITDRVPSEGVRFFMVTHRFDQSAPRAEQIGNVLVYRVGFGPSYLSKMLFIPLAAWQAAALNRREHFDALWAVMTYMLFPLVLSKALGVRGPYLLTLQDGDPYEKVFGRWFIRPFAPILNWGFRNATVVQAVSTYLATWPKKRGYKYRVEMIPNGASTESSQAYSEGESASFAKKIGKEDGIVSLLSVGRLVHQKGIDDVIRALALLPAYVKLVVVGDGPDRLALMTLAKNLHVETRVQFMGQVNRTETAKYRTVCDIFVLPSRSEGQGISFISTMLSGLPVVATQEGGIADFLFDAKRNPEKEATGWAVDKDSPEQIAAAVRDILAHPAEAKKVTKTAQDMVKEKYNWDNIAKDMRSRVFAKVLQKY
ncbi:MAG TPA: glycosyltransferase family 4 protein [Candidatus Paceibacterota bacterium]|nr:glycosyltransferase family 4 protein [Candidatus Paceibacterota bacterium]